MKKVGAKYRCEKVWKKGEVPKLNMCQNIRMKSKMQVWKGVKGEISKLNMCQNKMRVWSKKWHRGLSINVHVLTT